MTTPTTILGLPSATTPLSGNELVPITQNGITVSTTVQSLVNINNVFSVAVTAPAFIPTGSSIPISGLYRPASNQTGISASNGFSGNVVAIFANSGSANQFTFFNASSTQPIVIQATGTDTNIGIDYWTKGTGQHLFSTGYPSLKQQFSINSTGDVSVGNAAISTSATAGFFWIPSCAGAASGTPANIPYTNAAAMVYDSTDNKLYINVGGTWKSATFS